MLAKQGGSFQFALKTIMNKTNEKLDYSRDTKNSQRRYGDVNFETKIYEEKC